MFVHHARVKCGTNYYRLRWKFFFVMKRLRKSLQNTNNHQKTLHQENDPCNGILVALPLLNKIGCDIIAKFLHV